MEIKRTPNWEDIKLLKGLGYFITKPSQYIEYSPDSLKKIHDSNGKEYGYLTYVDIIDNLRIVPITWANYVYFEYATPIQLYKNVPYVLGVWENNETPSTFLAGHFYRRLAINDTNKLQLTKAVGVASFGNISNTDLLKVSELYGNLPIVEDHAELMNIFNMPLHIPHH